MTLCQVGEWFQFRTDSLLGWFWGISEATTHWFACQFSLRSVPKWSDKYQPKPPGDIITWAICRVAPNNYWLLFLGRVLRHIGTPDFSQRMGKEMMVNDGKWLATWTFFRHRIGPCGEMTSLKKDDGMGITVSQILAFSSFSAFSWPGLDPEDVRATYTIVMTGPGTAMLEFIDGARTLREVRSGPDTSLVSSRLFFSKGQLRAGDGRAWEMY